MLKIRLQRTGRKNVPTFRIVLTDSKNSTKSGKYLEIMGNHDARNDSGDVKKDRVLYWMSKGAQLTPTLHNMFISKKIITGKKVNVLPKKSPIVDEAKVAAEKAAAEAKVQAAKDAEAAKVAAEEAEKAAAEAAKVAAEAPAVEEAPAPAPETPEETPAA